MNLGATKRTFNNISYETYFFIYNSDITLTSPDLIDNKDGTVIPPDEVTYMMFENRP